MKSVPECAHCGLSAGVPHVSDVDCFRAVDREIKAAMSHLRSLTKRKSLLLRARLEHRRAAAARRRPR